MEIKNAIATVVKAAAFVLTTDEVDDSVRLDAFRTLACIALELEAMHEKGFERVQLGDIERMAGEWAEVYSADPAVAFVWFIVADADVHHSVNNAMIAFADSVGRPWSYSDQEPSYWTRQRVKDTVSILLELAERIQ